MSLTAANVEHACDQRDVVCRSDSTFAFRRTLQRLAAWRADKVDGPANRSPRSGETTGSRQHSSAGARLLFAERLLSDDVALRIDAFAFGPSHQGTRRLRATWIPPHMHVNDTDPAPLLIDGGRRWTVMPVQAQAHCLNMWFGTLYIQPPAADSTRCTGSTVHVGRHSAVPS